MLTKTKQIYQMVCTGQRKHFDGKGTVSSRLLYDEESLITDQVKKEFIKLCCNSPEDEDWFDLDETTCEVKVIVLELVIS